MRTVTVSVFKREHLVLLGVSDPDFFKDCFGVRMDIPDLSDPFNWSGLPYHIKQKVVSDFWATQEDQFVMDWASEAPEGEIRFGGTLNLYGTDDNCKAFPEIPDYPVSSHRREMFEQHDAQNRRLLSTLGLPEHHMKPTLRIPNYTNEVSYNGVKLSQLVIPESLNKTRDLVIEITKEVAIEDQPNLLTLFVIRGGNIHDLTEFFAIVKDSDVFASTLQKGVTVQVISDIPGDSADLWSPIDILMSQKAIVSDVEDHASPGFLVLVDDDGKPVSREEQQAYEQDILAAQAAEEQPRRPNPLREQWEKHGDPHEGRIPHVARFADIVSSVSQQGRNETMAFFLSPTSIGEPETLTPEEIVDREQAIQEASEGKLDYLLEGTQWDPKLRKD